MAHGKFLSDFIFKPADNLTIIYKAGRVYRTLPRRALDEAKAQGKAIELKPEPRKGARRGK